ncbi:hypothetical protein, conserved in T. vivax [Trypanosoma vivax Y486]|uniref:Uncharacterized protein n=1 Tax=Trypanosoma vivax (strain Y486) TaxID=1055687 RepID=F9WL37_TRYVY|nr:hypothetical protein, conserved in T. vivax [Trypanosoma vivax Y486]|eukprot:CCD18223.1 hypothetical protein, conserved in T. vivax [Trypanosoma vivax Y486]
MHVLTTFDEHFSLRAQSNCFIPLLPRRNPRHSPWAIQICFTIPFSFSLPFCVEFSAHLPPSFITEDVPPNKGATMLCVAKVRAVPWLPVLLSACCIYASTVFVTAHSPATASSNLNCNHKCCKNDTMQQFMNMSCTLGKLVGRANVTFSTLKNVGTMALEELAALTGSTAKRSLMRALDRTETVLSDIERCVNSTIPSEIFDTEHNLCDDLCLQVLKKRYERCKTDAENNKRFLTGAFHAGGRDFAEQFGGLKKSCGATGMKRTNLPESPIMRQKVLQNLCQKNLKARMVQVQGVQTVRNLLFLNSVKGCERSTLVAAVAKNHSKVLTITLQMSWGRY